MTKLAKQTEAARHLREVLKNRGFAITPRSITLEDDQRWVVFERGERQTGVDAASGVWVRASYSDPWRCICLPCTISGALQAVEFLIQA
jgi:hypothetical protein